VARVREFMPMSARRPYVPPTDPDAPLDEIEQALVRAIVEVLARTLRDDPEIWIDDGVRKAAAP